ncbi:MAG: autotransporter-associated beta strand repeat-containing protein [Chthoniobacter sp.]|nr:autotransporter-associated beta strand repeat-containing protein [Chthoniobacter sp.]
MKTDTLDPVLRVPRRARHTSRRILFGTAAALLALTFGTGNALATDGTWSNTAGGTYETAANWSGGINVADGVGATGTFTLSLSSSNRTITMNSSHTLGVWNLGQGGRTLTFSPSGGAVLTLDNTGSTNAQINVANGGKNIVNNVGIELMDSLDIVSVLANGQSLTLNTITVKSGASNSGNLAITNSSVGGGSPTTFFAGIISDGAGTISYEQKTAGFSAMGAANTFSGSTIVSGGVLRLDNALALQNSALDTTNSILGDSVGNGGAGNGLRIHTTVGTGLTLGGLIGNKNFAATGGVINTVSGGYGVIANLTLNPGTGKSYSYSGAIANGAANMILTKTGAGTQTLSGANTYTGATNVNVGGLYINGNQSSATGAVTVASTATLGGTGTIGGATTIQSGGIYSPGTTSPGTLTQAAGLSISGGGIFNWSNSTANASGTAGTDWSVANITGGSLTLDTTASTGSKLNLSFTSISTDFTTAFWDSNQSWNIITGGVSTAFDASNISIFINGVQQGSNNIITGEGAFTTVVSGSNERLIWTSTAASIPTAFWSGASSGDWGTVNNWNTTASGGVVVGILPSSATDVHFSTISPAPGNLGSVDLAADFAVKTLSFDAGAAAVTIGSANSSTLTITPASSTSGIVVDTTAGDNTVNVKAALGADQTWTVGTNRTLSATNQVSGGFALTKAGAGTLTLSGNNTFTGALIVQNGTLVVATVNDASTSGSMGASGSNAVRTQLGANGETGTLEYTGGTASTNRIWTIGGTGAVIQVDNPNAILTFNGSSNLNGTGTLTKTGPGTLHLTFGSSGYTNGTIVLSGGTLAGSGNNQVFGAGTVTLTLNANTTLDLNDTTPRNFGKNTTVNGSMTILSEKSVAGSGVDYTMGTLAIGASTLTVGGGNVTSGTAGLIFAATTLSGASTFNITNPVGGGTTQLTLGAVTNAGFTPTLTGNGNFAQSGATNGTGGFTLDATYSGLATLSQANAHTGTTTVGGGTLALAHVNAVQASTLNTGSAGAQSVTFTVAGTNTYNLGGLSGADDLNAGTNSLSVGANNGDTTFTGNGTATTFTKVGTGTLDLNGANQTYGTLVAQDGTTNVNGTIGSGTSVVTVTDTAGGAATKLRFGSVSQTLSSLSIGAGATVTFTSGLASGAFTGGGGKAPGFGGAATVPEPGTLGLLLVGALGVLNRRRRQA